MAPRRLKKTKVLKLSEDRKAMAPVKLAARPRRYANLSMFPLEILLEVTYLCTLSLDLAKNFHLQIFSYLPPVDLLHLARSNKWLHNVLMSRQARSLWRYVIKCVQGLPKCQSKDLCEPRYTSIMFDEFCEVSVIEFGAPSRLFSCRT